MSKISDFKNNHWGKFFLWLLVSFFIFSGGAFAKSFSTPNIPPQDTIYRAIDKFYAHGLIKSLLKGYRPYSRRQVALLLTEARVNYQKRLTQKPFSAAEKSYLDTLLTRCENHYADEIARLTQSHHKVVQYTLPASIKTETSYLHDDPRPTPNQNQGTTAAIVSPLTSYQQGRHFHPDGVSSILTLDGDVSLSPLFSLHVVPLIEAGVGSGADDASAAFRTLNARLEWHNLSLQLGRDAIVRGFGGHGGLIHTSNARFFDKIELANDVPFVVPGFLKYVGEQKISAFVANLGTEYIYDNTYLAGWGWNFAPLSFFELGIHHDIILGGAGQPGVSAASAIRQFIGFLPNGTAVRPGDSFFEINFRLMAPFLRGAEGYFDFALDDFNDEFGMFLRHNSAYLLGLYVPRLDAAGYWDGRVELQFNGETMYVHGQYASGKTLNNRAFGSHLGPGSMGIMLRTTHDFLLPLTVGAQFDLERYSSDVYTSLADSNGSIFDIVKTTNNPEEYRARLTFDGAYRYKQFEFTAMFGVEQVFNNRFVSGDASIHALTTLGVTVFTDGLFRTQGSTYSP